MLIKYPQDFSFKPRHYQSDVLRAFFNDKVRHMLLVQHRRSGKDRLCFCMMIGAALQRPGLYLYLFPKAVQGRKSLFKARGSDGIAFLDMIPRDLVVKTNSVEMSITLVNGSIIQVSGASTADTLVGSNPLGIVYSEFSLMPMSVRDYLSPILAENSGWELLNLTPRGRGPVYDLFVKSLSDPTWFVRHLSVDDTKHDNGSPIITYEEIDSFRKSGMDESIIQQEFFVSWNSSNIGSYYASYMDKAESEGRVKDFDIIKSIKCFAVFDIGISDATSIWIMQPVSDQLRLIYHYEASGHGFNHYAQMLDTICKQLGIRIQTTYGPHDLANRTWGGEARSALALARDAGIVFSIVPKTSIDDGIQAVMALFPQFWFHKTNCIKGIEAVRHYRREYDEELRTFKPTPLHDWSSHSSDSLRYLATIWRYQFSRPDTNQIRKYEISGIM